MPLNHLLAPIRLQVDKLAISAQPSPFPGYILFLSASNGEERAYTAYACGSTLDEAWQRAADDLQLWENQQPRSLLWLRADFVDKIQTLRWDELQDKFGKTKRNYFRFGLSLTPDSSVPFSNRKFTPTHCCITVVKALRHPMRRIWRTTHAGVSAPH